MKFIRRLSDFLEKLASYTAAFLLAAMVVIVFAQVIVRIIKGSLPWSEEIARYCMVYLAMLGSSVGVKKMDLVAVEILYIKMPAKVKKLIDIVVSLSIVAVAILFIYFGSKLVGITLMQKSPVLKIKMGYVYAAIVISAVMMLIHIIASFSQRFMSGGKDKANEELIKGGQNV